jgi:hypothetical protein
MQEARFKMETKILERYFPKKFNFENRNSENEFLDVGVKSQSGKIYRLKITLDDFPNAMPRVYITYPLPLLNKKGEKLGGPSHPMHTLDNDGNNIQICHYKSENWDASVTLYKVILKARIWIEAYECHLNTGKNVDDYLKS